MLTLRARLEIEMRTHIKRRKMLLALSGYGLGVGAVGCNRSQGSDARAEPGARTGSPAAVPVVEDLVLETFALKFQWQTFDPFLFCVHHLDEYPAGNEEMGPAASLGGRKMGSDFKGKDGWRMYHGRVVPGFPRHPHRGFETVTVTRSGFIDHSDSLGATARYGHGDVQWMTAGRGIVHAEMFPLLDATRGNHTELFQIWLNLPKRDKFVEPHFSMFWKDSIPEPEFTDDAGRKTRIRVIAGSMAGSTAPQPPPSSWASRADAELAIWSLRMQPGASFSLPAVRSSTDRTLYLFSGGQVMVGGQPVVGKRGIRLRPSVPIPLEAGAEPTELLLLQGKPIGEPVVQRGPFVMNDSREIQEAYRDYRSTGFGGWPWERNDPVHARDTGRFAVHADGRKETAI